MSSGEKVSMEATEDVVELKRGSRQVSVGADTVDIS